MKAPAQAIDEAVAAVELVAGIALTVRSLARLLSSIRSAFVGFIVPSKAR